MLNVQNLVEGMRLLIAQPVTLMVTIRLQHSRLPQRHVVGEGICSLLDKIFNNDCWGFYITITRMHLTGLPQLSVPKGLLGDEPLWSKKSIISLTFKGRLPCSKLFLMSINMGENRIPFSKVTIAVVTLSKEGDSGYSKPNMVRNDSALWLLNRYLIYNGARVSVKSELVYVSEELRVLVKHRG